MHRNVHPLPLGVVAIGCDWPRNSNITTTLTKAAQVGSNCGRGLDQIQTPTSRSWLECESSTPSTIF
ncbi:uncharacterized protein K444DRAFT_50406 [Hyaloscypha bicolor E]|uniref:Uncharacterized protein n=1 Tax=Hyaloscypha bicolor E TaxID=1095630 RepID=A0A2J6T2N5_9HELO|nr:uncharacterized protein K444DRAFT_50406 [Hyaloscypha bicolor E]PMD57282.1 hypothetical protein K444DRAFT_50406 [Hyaloscypha bicolor E]